jgi:hypothetical protein
LSTPIHDDTSFTLPLCDLRYSAASWLVEVIFSSHHAKN